MMEPFPQQLDVNGHSLVIDIAKEDEVQEIFQFLQLHFLPVVPVRQVVGYDDDNEGSKKQTWILRLVQTCLRSGPYSLVVREGDTRRLMAVRLNVVEERENDANSSDKQDEDPVGRVARAFLAELSRGIDLYSLYNTERILHLFITAVDSDYGRLGLGQKLYQLSGDVMAKAAGCGAIKAEAFSEYAARAALKAGCTQIKSIDYETFEFEGTRPMAKYAAQLAGIHRTARLMARPIP